MDIIRIVNAVFSSNTYVLREGGADWCWLVDVGDVEPVLEYIGEKGAIRGIFLTHTHYDHLYGINRMVDLFPQCVVYTLEAVEIPQKVGGCVCLDQEEAASLYKILYKILENM